VPRASGLGLEAAARQVRYDCFEQHLCSGEWLLLAHHRDDQIETVLLKLLRGAGPAGLGGMRVQRDIGNGRLWRPLLALPRDTLHAYVRAHDLRYVDDPSNADTRISRNFLRHEILPRLRQQFPPADASIFHSAALIQDAASTLQQQSLAARDQLLDRTTNSIDLDGWLALPAAIRDPLLDDWLHQQNLPAPTTAQREQIVRQSSAHDGQLPCIEWPGAVIYLWQRRLWAVTPQLPLDASWEALWHGETLSLPDGGMLSLQPPARLPQPLLVRWRRGGEVLKPVGDRHTRDLRTLFQNAGVPPWLRPRFPLLWLDKQLLAVADRWVSTQGQAMFEQIGSHPTWAPGAHSSSKSAGQ
jgi:tRNA(Ile)-lysidine synthase